MSRIAINSMSVNSIIASRKGAKRSKLSGRKPADNQFLEAEPSTLQNQICDIEEIISRYKENCVYASSYESSAGKDESNENKKMKGLLSLAESRLSLKASYAKLGALFGFGVIYVVTLFLQRDVQSAYGIETR